MMAHPPNAEPSPLKIEDIKSPQRHLHPALDWVEDRLILGVHLKQKNAVVSSQDGLQPIEYLTKLGQICARALDFESSVSQTAIQAFEDFRTRKKKIDLEDLVDGTLQHLAEYLRRFILFPAEFWPPVLAAWILGTYVYPIFQAFPYLRLTSDHPGSGKSVLGELLAHLSFNGEFMTSPNETHLFRMAEKRRGVQVWDEVERREEGERRRFAAIQSVLLVGYRNGASVPRQAGKDFSKTDRFHVFCPRVLIGLSKLPETAAQRCLTLRLEKRELGDDTIERYDHTDMERQEACLRDELYLAALVSASLVKQRYSDNDLRKFLEQILCDSGRLVNDIWLPLFSVVTVGASQSNVNLSEMPLVAALASAAVALSAVDKASLSESSRSIEDRVLEAAVHTLEWCGAIEPEVLAEKISQKVGLAVTASHLSRLMNKRLRIKSEKVSGRRTFKPDGAEIAQARKTLGLARLLDDATGQEDRTDGDVREAVLDVKYGGDSTSP